MINATDNKNEAKIKAMRIIASKADKKGVVGLLRVSDFFTGTEYDSQNKTMFKYLVKELQDEGFIEEIHYLNKDKLIVDYLKIESAWFETIKNNDEV